MNNQWEQTTDPVSGRVYYFNRSTGETSWSPPVHLPPPPHQFPPPPPQHDAQHRIVIGQTAVPNATPAAAPLQYQQYQQQPQPQTQPLTAPQNTNNIALYSSATYQLDPSTATNPGLLVPSIRAIIDKEQAQMTSKRKIELEGVSAGTIADLCNVSREWRSRNLHVDGGDFAAENNSQNEVPSTNTNNEAANHYYKPLQPFSLPLQSRPPHVEPGRVDIRMHALYSKLRSLAEENVG